MPEVVAEEGPPVDASEELEASRAWADPGALALQRAAFSGMIDSMMSVVHWKTLYCFELDLPIFYFQINKDLNPL